MSQVTSSRIKGTLSNVGQESAPFSPKPLFVFPDNSSIYMVCLAGAYIGNVDLYESTDNGVNYVYKETFTIAGYYARGGSPNSLFKLKLSELDSGKAVIYDIWNADMLSWFNNDTVDAVARSMVAGAVQRPIIIGVFSAGQVLTCVVSTRYIVNPSYQWQKDGVDISGATSADYTVLSGDIGHDITCVVTSSSFRAYLGF